jgi:hypothetical protein
LHQQGNQSSSEKKLSGIIYERGVRPEFSAGRAFCHLVLQNPRHRSSGGAGFDIGSGFRKVPKKLKKIFL